MITDREPPRLRLALALAAATTFALALSRLWLIPAHMSFNPNEGWNAFQAAAAMGAGPLYPDPGALTGDNYPPLSFLLVGSLARLVGDPIVAGRLLSVTATMATAAAIHRAVAKLANGGRTPPLLGAVMFLAFNATQYRTYLAMDDPQWMAHALMTAGLVRLLPGSAEAPVRPGAAATAAALMLAGGLIKHNLVAFPLAATLWLAVHHRRALTAWLGTALAAGALAVLLGVGLYGVDMVRDVLSAPRHTSWLRMWRSSALPIDTAAPMLVVSSALVRSRRADTRIDLVLLAIVLGVGLGVLQRSGQGVNFNAHFEGLIALCVGAPLALAGPSAQGARRGWAAALLALPFLVLAPLTVRDIAEELAHRDAAQAAWTQMRDRIARTPGPVACETLALCFWAGKPFVLDVFLYGQRVAATGDAAALNRALKARRFAAIEREPAGKALRPGDIANPILPLLDHAGPVVFTAGDGRRLIVPARAPG